MLFTSGYANLYFNFLFFVLFVFFPRLGFFIIMALDVRKMKKTKGNLCPLSIYLSLRGKEDLGNASRSLHYIHSLQINLNQTLQCLSMLKEL